MSRYDDSIREYLIYIDDTHFTSFHLRQYNSAAALTEVFSFFLLRLLQSVSSRPLQGSNRECPMCRRSKAHPFSVLFYFYKVVRSKSAAPCTLDKLPVQCRTTQKIKQTYTFTQTYKQFPNGLTYKF